MIKTIPYNLSFKIGDDLREVPEVPGGYKKGIKYLEKKVSNADDDEYKGKCLSTLGVLRRIAGDAEASLTDLRKAEDLFEHCANQKLLLINELRIGVSLKSLQRYDEAEKVFSKLETFVEENPNHQGLLHYIYHHRGKNEFERGNHQKALDAFRAALDLRLAKGNKDLISSSRKAITVVESKLSGMTSSKTPSL